MRAIRSEFAANVAMKKGAMNRTPASVRRAPVRVQNAARFPFLRMLAVAAVAVAVCAFII